MATVNVTVIPLARDENDDPYQRATKECFWIIETEQKTVTKAMSNTVINSIFIL